MAIKIQGSLKKITIFNSNKMYYVAPIFEIVIIIIMVKEFIHFLNLHVLGDLFGQILF